MWAEAARLEELRLVAREDRCEALIASGRTPEAIAELERLTSELPLRDRAQHKLIVALYRDGRQADALRAFQAHRDYLAEHVGLDPSPELVELEQMIATRDPRLDEVDGTAGAPRLPPRREARRGPLRGRVPRDRSRQWTAMSPSR